VFAHNGTIDDVDYLRAAASPERLGEVRGTTDSEVFFAFILTHLDQAEAAGNAADGVLTRVVAEIGRRPAFGACNFILSNGDAMYAFRQGRTLYVLERDPSDAVRSQRTSPETGAVIDTLWTQRRRAVLIASEKITDEPWASVDEGTLLKVTRKPRPEVLTLVAP
jgi:predicted glutamine amidotransferase